MRKIFILIFGLLLLVSCEKTNKTEKFISIFNKEPKDTTLHIELKKKFSLSGYFIKKKRKNQVAVSNENIYTFDADNYTIQLYNNKGKLLKSFGGKGTGPGEINSFGAFVFSNDTLYEVDNIQKKTHLFSKSGDYLYSKNNNFAFFLYSPIKFNKGLFFSSMIAESGGNFKILNTFFDRDFKEINKDTLISKHFDPNKDLLTDFIIVKASNQQNYYIAKNSKHSYEIEVYNKEFKKIMEIHKTYKMQKLNKYDKEYFSKPNRGKLPKEAKYHKAINYMDVDKYNRLWVLSGNSKNTNDSLIYFDIFKDGIFLNTVSFNILQNIKSKLGIENYFYIKGNYIFIYNDAIENFDVYEYN